MVSLVNLFMRDEGRGREGWEGRGGVRGGDGRERDGRGGEEGEREVKGERGE